MGREEIVCVFNVRPFVCNKVMHTPLLYTPLMFNLNEDEHDIHVAANVPCLLLLMLQKLVEPQLHICKQRFQARPSPITTALLR